MNIRQEIDQIKVELDNVDDPSLIAEFKRLLKNHGKPGVSDAFEEERLAYAKLSEIDIQQGKMYSPEEAFAELVKRVRK
ncbi:MAG: hypothetical protein ACI9FU_000483 [Granulosicoccus sp.]|jgi:hypothetical protein